MHRPERQPPQKKARACAGRALSHKPLKHAAAASCFKLARSSDSQNRVDCGLKKCKGDIDKLCAEYIREESSLAMFMAYDHIDNCAPGFARRVDQSAAQVMLRSASCNRVKPHLPALQVGPFGQSKEQ